MQQERTRRKTRLCIPPAIIKWLRSEYEVVANKTIPKERMYSAYENYCRTTLKVKPRDPNTFGKIVVRVFPHVFTRRLGPITNQVTHYAGICARSSPAPVGSPVESSEESAEPAPSAERPKRSTRKRSPTKRNQEQDVEEREDHRDRNHNRRAKVEAKVEKKDDDDEWQPHQTRRSASLRDKKKVKGEAAAETLRASKGKREPVEQIPEIVEEEEEEEEEEVMQTLACRSPIASAELIRDVASQLTCAGSQHRHQHHQEHPEMMVMEGNAGGMPGMIDVLAQHKRKAEWIAQHHRSCYSSSSTCAEACAEPAAAPEVAALEGVPAGGHHHYYILQRHTTQHHHHHQTQLWVPSSLSVSPSHYPSPFSSPCPSPTPLPPTTTATPTTPAPQLHPRSSSPVVLSLLDSTYNNTYFYPHSDAKTAPYAGEPYCNDNNNAYVSCKRRRTFEEQPILTQENWHSTSEANNCCLGGASFQKPLARRRKDLGWQQFLSDRLRDEVAMEAGQEEYPPEGEGLAFEPAPLQQQQAWGAATPWGGADNTEGLSSFVEAGFV